MANLTAREPLTVSEAETLAAMLNSASRHMSSARLWDGDFAWTARGGVSAAYQDMFDGFYQLMHMQAELQAVKIDA